MKIKEGIKHPKLKIVIDDWHGRVREVDKKTVDLELDSITLNTLKPEIIKYYEEADEYAYILTIPKKDLELTEKRDEFEEVEKAQDFCTYRCRFKPWHFGQCRFRQEL